MLQSSVRDLQSLVDKLVDVKEKFQNVWEKHQTRVLQSLEFAFFEQECMQVSLLLLMACHYSCWFKVLFPKTDQISFDCFYLSERIFKRF